MGYGTKQTHCISEEALSHKVDQWKMRSKKAMGVFIDPITAEIVTKEPEIPELTVMAKIETYYTYQKYQNYQEYKNYIPELCSNSGAKHRRLHSVFLMNSHRLL